MHIDLTDGNREFRRDMKDTVENHLRYYESIKWFMADQAMLKAKESSKNYRGFAVGCALYAWNPNAALYSEVHKIFYGANTMLKKGGHKICAEQVAMSNARAVGYELIVGIVVAGIPQKDSKSGLVSKTLHPCSDCREIFIAYPEIRFDTRLLTVHLADNTIFEEITVEELINLHN